MSFAVIVAVAIASPSAKAQVGTISVLHSFGTPTIANDGALPYAGLIQASDGNFYGTTGGGGAFGYGTVFQVTSAGAVNTIHSFGDSTVPNDGAFPCAALVQAGDGNLYGTTAAGGKYGFGTVFQISTSGAIKTLHSFGDPTVTNDGIYPEAPLAQASDLNLYGTTANGGSANNGTVFRIATSGAIDILHSFGDNSVANDGAVPFAPLMQAQDGNLYGTTTAGGSANCGTVYQISLGGEVKIVHSFQDGSVADDGAGPWAGLVQTEDGSLYGTTFYGGSTYAGSPASGDGVVYRITLPSSVATLHSFGDGSVTGDAINPECGLCLATDGSFYATSVYGGSTGDGAVFRITTTGAVTIVHSFGDGSVVDDGANSVATLIQATDGSFFGTTAGGGADANGTVFQFVVPVSVTISEPTLLQGQSTTGTVTLSDPAPVGGAVVVLASSNAQAATVPAEVTVPAGQISNTFGITAGAIISSTETTSISATFNGLAAASLVTSNPPLPTVTNLTLTNSSIEQGANTTANVTISAPAPAGGCTILLSSTNTAAATVPTSVTVTAGQTTATFTVSAAQSVTSNQLTSIGADYNSTAASANLTVTPPPISLTLSKTSAVSGGTVTGTITLSSPAPSAGAKIVLASSNKSAATVPASITIASGATSKTFTITTVSGLSTTQTSSISGSYNGNNAAQTLTVTPPVPAVSSVTLAKATIRQGGSTTGTVTMSHAAPAGGIKVTLSSSKTTAATVPASVTVAAGSKTAAFTVTAADSVSSSVSTSITATYNGAGKSAMLTVKPAALSTLTIKPATVTGSTTATGTITILGKADPAFVVSLSSSKTTVASVPSSVAVAVGSTSATFTITTIAPATAKTVTITATAGSVKLIATIKVNP
jgi:uncharacterized repeat protein (TIGR03803 family)